MNYIIALGLTLILEFIIALVWGIRKRDLLLVILANVFTNPLANLAHMLLYNSGFWINLVLPEIFVIIVEALLYIRKKNGIIYPVLFAVLSNAFSCLSGAAIQMII